MSGPVVAFESEVLIDDVDISFPFLEVFILPAIDQDLLYKVFKG